MTQLINERHGNPSHMGCSQCIVHCSNVYNDKEEKYLTSSLEYETIWSMGGMTGIDNLDTIARLDYLCDDIGLDTMSTGVALAVAMDAGYKKFGDGPAAIQWSRKWPKERKWASFWEMVPRLSVSISTTAGSR